MSRPSSYAWRIYDLTRIIGRAHYDETIALSGESVTEEFKKEKDLPALGGFIGGSGEMGL